MTNIYEISTGPEPDIDIDKPGWSAKNAAIAITCTTGDIWDDDTPAIRDLIADLCHLANALGLDVYQELTAAREHFEAEATGLSDATRQGLIDPAFPSSLCEEDPDELGYCAYHHVFHNITARRTP